MKNLTQVNGQRPGFWSGALFGALAGIGSLLTYQYLSGILRQPRLLPWTLLSRPDEFETQEAWCSLARWVGDARNQCLPLCAGNEKPGVPFSMPCAGWKNTRPFRVW